MVDPTAPVIPGAPWTWGDFDGWQYAGLVQRARLQSLVYSILWPTARAVGPLTPSRGGWWWSRHGYPRDGGHETGAFLDVVPQLVDTREAYRWIRDNLDYGEVIDERDHVHVSLPGFGGEGEAWILSSSGELVADHVRGEGVPLGLDYLTRTSWPGLAAAAALLFATTRRR